MAAKKTETKGVVVALTDADARKKALEVALGKIEKDFGKGSVMKLGENLLYHVSGKLSCEYRLFRLGSRHYLKLWYAVRAKTPDRGCFVTPYPVYSHPF